MTQPLVIGRIVWAEVADANGIRKLRPAVIVTATDGPTPTGPFDAVAVTSRLDKPLPEDHVLLPWHPRGHPRTGLNRRCAAVCTWLVRIMESDIQEVAGIVPTSVMGLILAKVAAASSSSAAGAAPPVASSPPAKENGSGKPPHDAVS
jgi:mRNA-degrading endonuclease toxin of MazEF toxin-antitoxin module